MRKPEEINILIGCEESQAVCIEFRKSGFNAYSNDLQECSGGHAEWHLQMDAIKALYSRRWDLVIAHPPCTKLANSGVRWLTSKNPRLGYKWCDIAKVYLREDQNIWKDFYTGVSFFNSFVLYGKLGNKLAIENPVQHKYATEEINCKYSQTIEPYQFGHKEKKKTLLWLFGLNPLKETNNVYKETMELPYSQRSKIHYISGKNRAKLRSKTYSGIAKAMAEQWGEYLLNETQPVTNNPELFN